MVVGSMITAQRGVRRLTKTPRLGQQNRQQSMREQPESPAARPEELDVSSWYSEHQPGIAESSSSSNGAGIRERGSYPSSSSITHPCAYRDTRSLVVGGPNFSIHSMPASRDRESSLESNDQTVQPSVASVPRKAYMDLTDAIALLDETCPNQDASPSLTPRTPLTPFPRNRRGRSRSSDNSSNHSNDITGERILETSRSQEKPQELTKQRRPFLRKIGISKTEDRPLLAKITAPRIIGKPYLEKIGPSRAVEKPFLEKIGTSKTLDRFTFEALRELPRAMVRRCQPVETLPLTVERKISPTEKSKDLEEEEEEEEDDDEDVVLCIIKDERDDEDGENDDNDDKAEVGMSLTRVVGSGGRTSGKGYLLKMYSFETEDLNEKAKTAAAAIKSRRDSLRGASLDDVVDTGPSSLPPAEDCHVHASSRGSDGRSTSVAELLKCRVTTSEEIFSASTGLPRGSPREATSWDNSPSRWPKRRARRVVAEAARSRDIVDQRRSAPRVFTNDESTPGSPSKRRISPEWEGTIDDGAVAGRTKNSYLSRETVGSPLKTRRQASNEEPDTLNRRCDLDGSSRSNVAEHLQTAETSVKFARCKSRRHRALGETMEKFGPTEYTEPETRRQLSEELLDRNRRNNESPSFDDPQARFERRGISSDNLKLSRETMVASVPSTSSLGYQSGDSSLVSQRSSHHSQDFVRGTLRRLYDKFELQEVPSESYAAFKRRTRANHHQQQQHHQHNHKDNQRTNNSNVHRDIPRDEVTTTNNNNNNNNNEDNSNKNNTAEISDPAMGSIKGKNEPRDSRDASTRSASEEISTASRASITTKSLLRKQEGVDHQSDQETDDGSSLRRPKRRLINEPSQETMDLLTELRRVKSLLRTPSFEAEASNDYARVPTRFPKKILLTDREFCLSVERENSVRRRASILDDAEGSTGVWKKPDEPKENREKDETTAAPLGYNPNDGERTRARTTSRRQRAIGGPALFEKRCLSLDYADDEKPPKPEARAISLVASSRTGRSEIDDYDNLDSSDPAGLAYDARSYSSDVFTSPSDENDEPVGDGQIGARSSEESTEAAAGMTNHCAEIDKALSVRHVGSTSPKRRIYAQGRTSDLYEIISPRSTPFRVKKRLGRISVEETMKQESFTLSKVDCRTIVTQKRTKCFPM